MKLRVLIHAAEEGGYWAEAPALPGCVSQGETIPETLKNLREAAEGWLLVAEADHAESSEAQYVEIEL
jgi:predicted RNase H-like HicB family nuclease